MRALIDELTDGGHITGGGRVEESGPHVIPAGMNFRTAPDEIYVQLVHNALAAAQIKKFDVALDLLKVRVEKRGALRLAVLYEKGGVSIKGQMMSTGLFLHFFYSKTRSVKLSPQEAKDLFNLMKKGLH